MFCPKCGSQNSDGTRFCRGCGADVGNVLAVVDGKPISPLSEKHIDMYTSGLRGLITGLGFVLVSGVSFAVSMRLAVLGIFALAFAVFFLGTGVARLIQARALKQLRAPDHDNHALTPGHDSYIEPGRSIYATDDLVAGAPHSITEHTTTHLEMDPEARGRETES